MDNIFFKLVCVCEQDPLEYTVLEDVNLPNLDDVHTYVVDHIGEYNPDKIKWILLPMKKNIVKIDN